MYCVPIPTTTNLQLIENRIGVFRQASTPHGAQRAHWQWSTQAASKGHTIEKELMRYAQPLWRTSEVIVIFVLLVIACVLLAMRSASNLDLEQRLKASSLKMVYVKKDEKHSPNRDHDANRGSFGKVYKAQLTTKPPPGQSGTNNPPPELGDVAVKVCTENTADELDLLTRCKHDNILQVRCAQSVTQCYCWFSWRR